ncbi:Bax inhibitor-1 family protein [Aestuariibius sp. 2305UL40-4]|uniref:Bax inhibitor-1/YccA family protein n=1 Tax=Aestuariibius violaceus TaxID=3234132 RepID=UPI00345F0B7F
MAEYANVRSTTAGIRTQEIDQGLRAHMNKVYGLMSAALFASFAIGYVVSATPALMSLIFGTPLFYVVVFGPLAFVLISSFAFERLSVAALNGLFWAYAALTGASLAMIFAMFATTDIITGLLFTSVAFLGLTLTGYTTKRNLGPIGQVGIMMAWGLVAIGIGSMFFGGMGDAMFMLFNIAILGVFAVLTAYSTQEIKNTYIEARTVGGPEADMFLEKAAIIGALQLYISFIAIFRSIMYIFMPQE